MQKGHHLEFQCHGCNEPVGFSIFALDQNPEIHCKACTATYRLEDEALKIQLKKFDALCCQIQDSQEILSSASIGVDVGRSQVKIPFKLLLTRLSSYLDLKIGGKPCTFSFRFEPLSDMPLLKEPYEK